MEVKRCYCCGRIISDWISIYIPERGTVTLCWKCSVWCTMYVDIP